MGSLKMSCLFMLSGSLLFTLFSNPLGPVYENARSSCQTVIFGRRLSELSLFLEDCDQTSDSTTSISACSSVDGSIDDCSAGCSDGSTIDCRVVGSADRIVDCSYDEHLRIFSCESKGNLTDDDSYSDGDDFQLKFDDDEILSYGYVQEDFDRSLTNSEIFQHVSYYLFFISKEDAFIGFYYYIIYLNRCYNNVMRELKRWFANTSRWSSIPNDVQMKYWDKCKTDQRKILTRIQQDSKSNFERMVKGKNRRVLPTSRYFGCLILCKELWRRAIEEIVDKWTDIYMEEVANYNEKIQLPSSGGGDSGE
ncbi:hypothetical protein C922_02592 [Plasmodium inui San Antonio 1]|uniref:Plasmodium RESA N-terminal domain-containing protein n=1 Tax=Plasmodium inui San Antonio 1 TaxID=1237626 RepID=W7A708_9APIC|nr:hypothetical protein C922_02592 [Plasmodium inui San Antonio 1]EUD67008.1 hypothetical protein C922_02592 [Plasmodium inui San Antonio 1]